MINLSILLFPKLLLGQYRQENGLTGDKGVDADIRAARERARKRP
jgi:hypothetical protein